MKKNIILILGIASALSMRAQSSELNSNCDSNPPDFNTSSYEAISHKVNIEYDSIVVSKTKRICPEYITNLVVELQSGKLNDDYKALAIYLLGELHPCDTNSIEVLIKDIDLTSTKHDPADSFSFSRWKKYPAEEALVKIGKPVIEPILNHLPKETSELRRQLMCDVLKQVLRSK